MAVNPMELSDAASNFPLPFLPDSTEEDSGDIDLIFPFDDESNEGINDKRSPLYLDDPSNVKKEFIYDPETGEYKYVQMLGDNDYRSPTTMTLDEYLEYDMEKSQRDFWRQKAAAETLNESQGFRPQINVKGELFDRIFGGNTIDIRPQGSAELSFGVNVSRRDNPILPERQRRTSTFDFNQKIQLNVIGNIGEKLKIQTNYNTEATFDFENQLKVEYTGYEDEIIQKIEAGNVNFPLQSSLITGSQTLFGVKTELQFGRLRVTTLFSQERGEKKEINITGGATVQEFEKSADDYEDNKHYFLSHLFRESYEENLSKPPRVTSRINVTAVEVYITNTQGTFNNTRNILAFTDLGTDRRIYNPGVVMKNPVENVAFNGANNLYKNLDSDYPNAQNIRNFNDADAVLQAQGLESGSDYERLENAILLSPNEYTLNPELGYISLNRTLNPQDVLAVAYRYTYNGKVYQVGDLSTDGIDGQQALYLQLLKGTIIDPSLPSWDLMMKNVYSLDAFNISAENFNFDIWYLNEETGVEIPYFPEGKNNSKPLTNVLGLDRIAITNEPTPDGQFDYLPGVTINPQNGRIYFPVLEPFGDYLRRTFDDPALADKFAFDSLYSTTKILARQDVDKNRYTFRGRYQSSSGSEISLNAFNIPQGSVTVTAGGARLTENVDYTVDYNLGRVRILNEGILASGQPIKVSLGSNSLFNVQTKTLIGSRFDYRVSDDINIGGTILNLTERPLTRKINIGDEPISNTVVGIDGSFQTEAPFLTRAADLLPFYSTKEKSVLTVTAEAARLFPGNSRAITKDGIAYIDDFEGSQTVNDIRSANAWYLASTPEGQDDLFPEGNFNNDRAYNYNRARLAWYTIDPLFFRNDNRTPSHIRNSESQSNNFSREILETEVFPNKDPEPGLINNLPTLDLAFYPNEPGPYNYDAAPTAISDGLNPDGSLATPQSRWGGIMRQIQNSDFEASNVEFIQFWIMDPFNPQDGNPNHGGGELYFNLGSVSEDILKDGRKSFENGFPIDGSNQNTAATIWGRIPTVQSVVNAFDNNIASRENQDIGLDGLDDAAERAFFQTYLNALANILSPQALAQVSNDPSKDNYHYYRGGDYDAQQLSILERYKMFNGHQGNSPTSEQSPESYPTAATTLPDVEDVNRNFNLDRTESYYQYRVPLSPALLQPNNVGSNYITDVVRATKNVNGQTKTVNWYQFKIPIRDPEKVIGNIRDFKSIRFMRMFLKGFNEDVVVRFARLGLVRGEWREYTRDEIPSGDTHGNEPGTTTFNIGAVNVEENSNRVPINYTIPPDIDREIDFGTTNLRQLNEQSLVLDVCDLQDGYSKFAFRYLDLDIRQYKRLKMYAHAEAGSNNEPLNNGDVAIVLRLGTDFDDNYYEYEVPLQVTLPGQNSPEQVWPASNEIDLQLDKLINAKQNRNRQTVDPNTGVSINTVYQIQDGNNVIRVRGNPNLAEVRVVMIGVRNRRAGPSNPQDDGFPKCAEVWANELRLSDFNNDGGWAAQARVNAQVADLGTVNLSGSMSTPGWGSIEQKLNERQRETRQQYDLSASLDLAKFLPDEVNVSIPMYYSQSEAVIRPEFNPLDPDVKLNDLLRSDEFSRDYKDSIRKITDDYTRRRSINFTNVRKLPSRNKERSNFYDIENFNVTYAYTEIYKRDVNTKYNKTETYKGALNYNYSGKAKNIQPFQNVKLFKENKAFALLRDLNFNPVPSQISVQNIFDRFYQERQARNITNNAASSFVFESPPFYQKSFNWSRIYSLRYNPAKSITFNFNASNRALIGEPEGKVDRRNKDEYDQFKQEVWQNIQSFGDNTQYNHNFDINYTLPINKIPGLEFITASTRYSATFAWDRIGNPEADTSLGATIRNSNTKAFQVGMNMDAFWNKFEYIRRLKDPSFDNKYIYKEEKDEEDKKNKKDKGEDEGVGEDVQGESAEKQTPRNRRGNFANRNRGGAGESSESEEPDTNKVKKFVLQRYILDNAIWTIMSLKTLSLNYNETHGTILPNYGEETNMLGMSPNWGAPGFGFVSGMQEPGDRFLNRAFENDWLVDDGAFVSGDFSRTYSKQLSMRATLRPIEGLRIQLTANKNQSQNVSKFFFFDDADTVEAYNFDAPQIVSGSYSMSILSIGTSFKPTDENDFSNSTFSELQSVENREIISRRLGNRNINSGDSTLGEFAEGYGPTSQEVLLFSFLAAYTDKSPNDVFVGDFTKMIPLPNWDITYDGLSRLDFFKKYFRTVTIRHAYRSTFAVGSYTRNQRFGEENGAPSVKDPNGNFITDKQLSTASISEQFSPLINLDFTWKSGLLTRLEMRRDRNISLSFANNQVTEVQGREYIIGLGYRLTNLKLPFKIGKLERSSDVDLRADISIRDNQTIIRRIVENRNELTAGQRIFTIKFTADYRLSNKLNVQLYYDRVANTPLISTTFPTANTNAGIRLRFTLSQ
ncbi:MAG: cell surface protein SprA [Flavobacteriales bacterium]|nr:cell surface protein SprA [Flavobacteriales bacterium]